MEAPEFASMIQKTRKAENLENVTEDERMAFIQQETTELKEIYSNLCTRLLELYSNQAPNIRRVRSRTDEP